MREIAKGIISALPQWWRSHLLPLIFTIRAAGLFVAALGLWGFAQIADEVLEKETQTIDTAILLAIRSLHTPLLDRIMRGITFVGEPTVLLGICLGFGIWLHQRGKRSQAMTLAIAGVGAIGLNYLLKVVFGRARPALWDRVIDVGQYSFPSGHAMISMVVYGAIGYLLVKQLGKWRIAIASGTLLLITSIGLSRLYLGVHWPTDVVAGYAAGIVWLMTCILSLEIWQEYRQPSSLKTPTSNEESNITSRR
jgi:undecaprenyl-diphosphatase